ncbi:MAG: hypothetical protein ACOY33_12225 [Pseudomonadota bacterium]
MKRMTREWLGGLALLLAACVVQAVPLAAPRVDVVYSKPDDKLSVNAVNAPLLAVLAEVARQTGLEIKADPKADREINQEFSNLPLPDALDRVTAKLNVIKQYGKQGKGKEQRNLLIAIVVLPEGQTDASAALALLNPDAEATMRASLAGRTDGKKKRLDFTAERWNARVARMDPERRKKYEEQLRERLEKNAAKEKKRQEMAAERKQRQDARDARREDLARKAAAARGEEYKPRQPDPELARKAREEFAQPATPAVIEPEP